MNFFDFNADSRRIVATDDLWIFVLIWLVLTAMTGAGFFLIYRRKKGAAPSANI
jgi:hypothetical protein